MAVARKLLNFLKEKKMRRQIYFGFEAMRGLEYTFVGEPVPLERCFLQSDERTARRLLRTLPHADAVIVFQRNLSYETWATQAYAYPIRMGAGASCQSA